MRPGKLLTPLLKSLPEAEALQAFKRNYDVSHGRALLCLDASRSTLRADALLRPEDVCLYIGIPFCPTRCAYCSFVSQSTEKSMKLIPLFLEALHRELDAVARQVRDCGLRVVSIYMGGGTPTTLSAAQLDTLFLHLEAEFDLSSLRECISQAFSHQFPDFFIVEGNITSFKELHALKQPLVSSVTPSGIVTF